MGSRACQEFEVCAIVDGKELAVGVGSSKKKAEQEAAGGAYKKLISK